MAGLYFFCCIFLLQNDVSGGTCFTGTLAHGALSFGIKTLKCLQKGRTAGLFTFVPLATRLRLKVICAGLLFHIATGTVQTGNRWQAYTNSLSTATLLPDCHQVTVTVKSLFFQSARYVIKTKSVLTDHTAYCAVGREAPWRCRVDKYVLNWSNTKVTFLKVKCEKRAHSQVLRAVCFFSCSLPQP